MIDTALFLCKFWLGFTVVASCMYGIKACCGTSPSTVSVMQRQIDDQDYLDGWS